MGSNEVFVQLGFWSFIFSFILDIVFAWQRKWVMLFASFAFGCTELAVSIVYLNYHSAPAHGVRGSMTPMAVFFFMHVIAASLVIVLAVALARWWTTPPEDGSY